MPAFHRQWDLTAEGTKVSCHLAVSGEQLNTRGWWTPRGPVGNGSSDLHPTAAGQPGLHDSCLHSPRYEPAGKGRGAHRGHGRVCGAGLRGRETHTYAHTCTQAHACVHTRTHMHIHMHAHTCTYMCVHICMKVHVCTRAYTHEHAHIHAYTRAHPCVHTQTHARMHDGTHVHTYTCEHT